MNSTTPAYSVVAFLLLAGSTLLAMPQSVLSQSTSEVPQESVAEEAITETLVNDDQLSVELISDTGLSVPTEETDSYTREKLPGDFEVYGDFVVGPGRFAIDLAPSESKTVMISISNRMGVEKRFRIETEDIAGTNDPAQALVLLGDDRGPYTIKDYISVPNEQFSLEHSYRARIPVTVSLPADAPPGGRYGSLLVSVTSDPNDEDGEQGAAPTSVVVSRIGVLFFISNPGDIAPQSELKDFSTIGEKKFYTTGPIQFGITHENTGNVHTTPYGELAITNIFNEEVGFVEIDPWFVLPKSLRTREISWNRELLIGRYVATVKINRGYDDVIDEQSYVFWVLPWKLLVTIFVGLFLVFLMIRFVATRFEFKRK